MRASANKCVEVSICLGPRSIGPRLMTEDMFLSIHEASQLLPRTYDTYSDLHPRSRMCIDT